MSYFLLSLHDPINSKGALGIFCSETGLRYLQIEEMSPLVKTAQFRGITLLDNMLYVVTPSSLRKYHIDTTVNNNPIFQLDKEIILPEWLGAKGGQGNLLPIYACQHQKKLYVACNALASIDEFDLDLNFIQRRYLWDIAPNHFSLPKEMINNYQYGHIRNITEASDHDIYITVALCNNTEDGVIINYNTGDVLLDNLVRPHGGLFYNHHYYLLNAQEGELYSYHQDRSMSFLRLHKFWSKQAIISNKKYQHSKQNFRGMIGDSGKIYCGVCNFQKQNDEDILPRVVSFDAKTGEQKSEVYLPDLEVFRRPRIFYMKKFELAKVRLDDALTVYQYGKKVPAKIYIAQKSEVVPEITNTPNPKVESLKEKPLKKQNRADISKEKEPQQSLNSLPDNEFNTSNHQSKEIMSEKNRLTNNAPIENRSVSVSIKGVSLCYQRNAVFAFGKNKHLRKSREFCALKDISFDLYEGETVGLIGRNGSGKSTMGMLISGTLTPDKGKVMTKGRVQLLSLGIGFRKDLIGRDNVFISATLLGMTRKAVAEKMADIEDFAELGEFIDEPVRTYSAGMRSRLAFAVATAVEPDILILDEVMSTGDLSFRKKAQARMKQMQGKVKTVVMVSHNSNQIKKLCNRVIWLEKGCVLMDGKPKEIVSEYEKFCQNKDEWLERHPEYAQLMDFR